MNAALWIVSLYGLVLLVFWFKAARSFYEERADMITDHSYDEVVALAKGLVCGLFWPIILVAVALNWSVETLIEPVGRVLRRTVFRSTHNATVNSKRFD